MGTIFPIVASKKIFFQQPRDRLISECPIGHNRVVNAKSCHIIDLCHLNNIFESKGEG